ncbi:hypothetical protein Agub_g4117 [Astrephomene gubernaculifera]|uniref:Uncharacterized protein n=1 Tax=Astrephomene gubernaculifera TaxID=47775 RepID=A0AAD3HJY5_9CHLO|nr:hypothetical protein Agub_g4117 [Astrephomene gubernaculifera]
MATLLRANLPVSVNMQLQAVIRLVGLDDLPGEVPLPILTEWKEQMVQRLMEPRYYKRAGGYPGGAYRLLCDHLAIMAVYESDSSGTVGNRTTSELSRLGFVAELRFSCTESMKYLSERRAEQGVKLSMSCALGAGTGTL